MSFLSSKKKINDLFNDTPFMEFLNDIGEGVSFDAAAAHAGINPFFLLRILEAGKIEAESAQNGNEVAKKRKIFYEFYVAFSQKTSEYERSCVKFENEMKILGKQKMEAEIEKIKAMTL